MIKYRNFEANSLSPLVQSLELSLPEELSAQFFSVAIVSGKYYIVIIFYYISSQRFTHKTNKKGNAA